MSIRKKIFDFIDNVSKTIKGGGEERIQKQYKSGKLTARDRIDYLLDDGTFFETDLFVEHQSADFGLDKQKLPADGVVTGFGTVNGKKICIFAQDFTVAGGSLGEMHAKKITKIMDLAEKMRVPLIGINDSGGARIQEGVASLSGYGEIFYRNSQLSGVIPQISVILGPCAGGAVYSPALTDFVFTVDKITNMFITGPAVIKTVLGEEISKEDLGGAKIHNTISGNAHFYYENEQNCFDGIKDLLRFIPSNNSVRGKKLQSIEPNAKFDLHDFMPDSPKEPYDVHEIIYGVVDNSEFFEVQKDFAKNIVVGFAFLNGTSIGVVANQPKFQAGVLDVDSSDKAARFIRFCDAFNIPLVTFVDLPGYLPGIDQEYAGVIRHGAKLLYAYSEASVPKLTVITRKAYGGGYIAMCSKHLNADMVLAWPTAEIAVMGPEGAANIIFRRDIMNSDNPEKTRQEKIDEYTKKFANPYIAAKKGYIDAVIHPEDTRKSLISALELSLAKKEPHARNKKHGNIPL